MKCLTKMTNRPHFHGSPMNCYIDDDIQHGIQKLITARTHSSRTTPEFGESEENHDDFDFEASLCCMVQQERNHWKDKLQAALQEIDKYHKESLSIQMALQSMARDLGLVPANDCDENFSNWGSTGDIIKCLKKYINITKTASDKPLPTIRDVKADNEISKLKSIIANLQYEKGAHQEVITQQDKQICWLNKEHGQIKLQLHKLRNIVRNYNESHSSKFHLDVVESQTSLTQKSHGDSKPLERTYTEGELLTYPSPRVESDAFKARIKQKNAMKIASGTGIAASPRAMISQCLRCQKLFRQGENNSLACRFHKKGREIKEQYDETGKLAKVIYKWACCKKLLDMPGCTYGHHI